MIDELLFVFKDFGCYGVGGLVGESRVKIFKAIEPDLSYTIISLRGVTTGHEQIIDRVINSVCLHVGSDA